MTHRYTGKLVAVLLALVSLFGPALGSAWAAPTRQGAASKAVEWMKTQQQPDGSYMGFGAGSTVDAVLALVAAGADASAPGPGGRSAVDFLQGKSADLAKTPGGAGKLLVATSALNKTGKTFAGTQALVDAVNAGYDAATGHYGKDVIGHAFAMLGLSSVSSVPEKAASYLTGVQAADGGWSFGGDTKAGASDTNTTAVVLQALAAVGLGSADPAVKRALAYMNSQMNDDGGFPYQKGGENGSESDVNSTAYAAQALISLKVDASKSVAYIMSMQKPDGAFAWKKSEPDDNAGATYQAVPVLLGATLVQPVVVSSPAPPAEPGMPRTGESRLPADGMLLAGLALLALGGGWALRRTSPMPGR